MQPDILIHYRDELRCTLQCNPGISFEISEEFAFFVNGYKFMPQYRAGRWDGRIRLYDVRQRAFYIGLLPRLKEWAEESGYTIGYADGEQFFANRIPFDQSLYDDLLTKVKFKPKWYQDLAVKTALQDGKTLILSPTGSGKSFIIYLIARYLVDYHDMRILITVPSTSLVEQLTTDFIDYTIDDWDAESKVHKLYGGKEKMTDRPIVISTWQTAWKLPKAWFSRFWAYMCDEAHGADAKCISGIVDQMAHAPIRTGLTGTLDGTVMHELDMMARFGKLKRVASTKELMDDGDLAQLEIDCIQLKYEEEDIKIVKHLDYQKEVDFLISHPKRNKIMAKIAANQPGNVLMLFNYIQKHGEILYKLLEPLAEKRGKKLYYIHGKTEVEDREKIRQILEKENNAILLASFGTLSTGVNIKNLHFVMFCHPYKAAIKTLQSIGRVLRLAEGKVKAKLIDFADDLSYTTKGGVKKQNLILGHFLQRLKLYVQEKFKYKIIVLRMSEL